MGFFVCCLFNIVLLLLFFVFDDGINILKVIVYYW